jgi:inosine-uridine nucleoside N-ribohydrolase
MIDIIGVVISTYFDDAVTSLDSFFTAEGRPGLAIGIDFNAADMSGGGHGYQSTMATHARNYSVTTEAERAVRLYRRALANAKKPIDILATGFLNNIQALLQSPADDISPLTGMQLVTNNVRHLWVMGGDYPTGTEVNFSNTAKAIAASSYVCANFPKPITFAGFTVGKTVIIGDTLSSIYTTSDDILFEALTSYGTPTGREAWDPMTTYLAIHGDPIVANFSTVKGTNVVDPATGTNTFTPNTSGNHEYVVKLKSDAWYKRELNKIIERTSWVSRPMGSNSLSKYAVPNGLVLWLNGADFKNSPQSTVWKDKSVLGNDVTANGFSYTSSSGSDGNGGVVFNGTSNYLSVASPTNIPALAKTRSIETVINASAGARQILCYGSTTTYKAFAIDINPSGFLTIDTYNHDWTTTYKVPTGVKKHICVTFDGTTIKLYVDGTLQDSTSDTQYTSLATVGYPLNIGKFVGVSALYFKGTCYDIKIYNRTLSASEIATNAATALA